MTKIRVDPPLLREQAKVLEQHAEEMHQLAHQVLSSAESVPSYDGQFGPKVRALAAQAQAELSRRSADIHERAEQLGAIAARFEQADLESVAGMERLAVTMQSWLERSGATLAGWVRSPSGQSFFQRLSSLASVADVSEQPWWAPIVLGWQSSWLWFDRTLGAPIRGGLRPRVGSTDPTSQTVTPIVTPTPPPPTATATPTPQPPHNPFFDPLANENRSITTPLRFVEPPFSLLEGNPGDPPVDLAGNRLALLLQLIRGFNRTAIPYANANYMASVEPNVDFSLHYSTYDDGVRIPGLRIDNHSEVPVVIGRAEIEQWRVGPQEIPIQEGRFEKPTELVIPPGEVGYFEFDLSETTFPREARIDIRVIAAGVTPHSPFGQIGWSVSGLGGAIELPPGP